MNDKTKNNSKLFKKETKMLFYGGVIGIPVGIIASFIFFLIANNPNFYRNEEKLIYENKINGNNQDKIKNINYVQAYLNHLENIENNDATQGLEEMSKSKKSEFNNSEMTFKTLYYLTHRYNVKYIIPEYRNPKKNKAEFWALIEYEDLIYDYELEKIRQIGNKILQDTAKIVFDSYVNEIYNIIYRRFEISLDSINKGYNDL
ncbi:hypothetical protein FACS189413_14550 [Bacteroidia bacterium]|nr:hypothetical protein FACS189413_14550 [Bacteroidia bacterium]